MQYWKPASTDEFAGDMMPFWDGERFHLFYLLDRRHHAEQGGLGGHQWAHASTSDLVRWEHHPLALPIGKLESVDQHGICTGSIFEHAGLYHAFYATRIRGADGAVSEVICRAVSRDLVHFDKSPDNPLFAAPPDLEARNHRDPFVFRHAETGFHMLVTASRPPATPEEGGERGVLAHYTSEDMEGWHYRGPFLTLDRDPTPECPELFFWNGWWYLIYSQGAQLQYWVSREQLGPWRRARRDTIEGPNLSVPRTASWTDGRRLAVGFLPWRAGERDTGGYVYAGSAVFRELVQDADGTLATRFVPEMMSPTSLPLGQNGGSFLLDGRHEPAIAQILDVPADAVLSLRIVPHLGIGEYGLLLRSDAHQATGYRLGFHPAEGRVTLQPWPEGKGETRAMVEGVKGLDQAVNVVVCMKGSVIDVCLNNRHTLIERCFDYQGPHLGLFAKAGEVRVDNLQLSPLL